MKMVANGFKTAAFKPSFCVRRDLENCEKSGTIFGKYWPKELRVFKLAAFSLVIHLSFAKIEAKDG